MCYAFYVCAFSSKRDDDDEHQELFHPLDSIAWWVVWVGPRSLNATLIMFWWAPYLALAWKAVDLHLQAD